MKTKRSFKYWQWRVIICSMIGYALFYFVRKNFAFAMPSRLPMPSVSQDGNTAALPK